MSEATAPREAVGPVLRVSAAEIAIAKIESVDRALPFREWRWTPWLLVLSDLLALELCVVLGYLLRSALIPIFPIELPPETYQGMALGVLVLPVVFFFSQLYPGYQLTPVERMRRRLLDTALVFFLLAAWDYLAQDGQWSRGILLATFAFALVLAPVAEALVRQILIATGRWGLPVVLIGAGDTGRRVSHLLLEEPELGLMPVGFLDDDAKKWGDEVNGVPVLGPVSMAERVSRQAKLAVLTMAGVGGHRLAELTAELPFANVIVVPNLMGLQSLWVVPRDLAGVLSLEVKKNLMVRRNRVIKRASDYALGIPAFILSLPVMGLLALMVKLASPGPAFYAHEREGLDGRKIRMLKLRTMHLDAEKRLAAYLERHPERQVEWRRYFKLRGDPRVIPWLGPFLRRNSLDELPQLWNVLRGEMSLVGPRPFPCYHLDAFEPAFRDLRRSVRPGITGLWQVKRRSEGDLEVQQALDTYYIRNWSLWLDLHILFRTVAAVTVGRGAR